MKLFLERLMPRVAVFVLSMLCVGVFVSLITDAKAWGRYTSDPNPGEAAAFAYVDSFLSNWFSSGLRAPKPSPEASPSSPPADSGVSFPAPSTGSETHSRTAHQTVPTSPTSTVLQNLYGSLNRFAGTIAPVPVSPFAAVNLIANPSLEDTGSDGLPVGWHERTIGINDAAFLYPADSQDGQRGAKVTVASFTSGDAEWYFDHVPVTPGKTYYFRDYYQSDALTSLTVEYKKADGTLAYEWLTDFNPSASWTKAEVSFVAPPGVVSLTVFHALQGIGSLLVDSYSLHEGPGFPEGMVSLNFDDGFRSVYTNAIPRLNAAHLKSTQYIISKELNDNDPQYMHAPEVLEMERMGHEIGAHTKTHAHLATLDKTRQQDEILGSRQDLLRAGTTDVSTFAYPYGEYNQSAKDIAASGFKSARGTSSGYNLPGSDLFALRVKNIFNTTTAADIRAAVDEALAKKLWLILVYHAVAPGTKDPYGTTPAILQDTIDYLVEKRAKVVTNKEGSELLQMLTFSAGENPVFQSGRIRTEISHWPSEK